MINTRNIARRNRPLVLVVLVTVLLMQWPYLSARLSQDRWYRDLTGLTPFRDVQVYGSATEQDGIVVWGEMVKERCWFRSLTGYVYFDDRLRRRVRIDTSVEDARSTTGNRPPSPLAETWGPWKLVWKGDTPTRWEIFAAHDRCPTGPVVQQNLFASGPWGD